MAAACFRADSKVSPSRLRLRRKKGLGITLQVLLNFLARQRGIEPLAICLEAFLRDKGKHHRSNNFRGVAPFTPPLPLSYYRVIEVGSDRSIYPKERVNEHQHTL